MKLDYLQALKRVDEARGAWVLHGPEPLLEQTQRCGGVATDRRQWDDLGGARRKVVAAQRDRLPIQLNQAVVVVLRGCTHNSADLSS